MTEGSELAAVDTLGVETGLMGSTTAGLGGGMLKGVVVVDGGGTSTVGRARFSAGAGNENGLSGLPTCAVVAGRGAGVGAGAVNTAGCTVGTAGAGVAGVATFAASTTAGFAVKLDAGTSGAGADEKDVKEKGLLVTGVGGVTTIDGITAEGTAVGFTTRGAAAGLAGDAAAAAVLVWALASLRSDRRRLRSMTSVAVGAGAEPWHVRRAQEGHTVSGEERRCRF